MENYRVFEFIDMDGDIVRFDAPISTTWVEPTIEKQFGFFSTKEIVKNYCFGVRLTNGRNITWTFSNPNEAVLYRDVIVSAYLNFYKMSFITLDLGSTNI